MCDRAQRPGRQTITKCVKADVIECDKWFFARNSLADELCVCGAIFL